MRSAGRSPARPGSRPRARSRRCRRRRRRPPPRGARRSPPGRPRPRRSPRRSRRPRTPPWTGCVAGETTSTSAPSTSSPSDGAQQVGVDGLGREDEQLHVEAATPGSSATNGAASCGRDAQDDDRDVVAHRAALHLEHRVLDVAGGRRPARGRGTRSTTRASCSGPKRWSTRARLDHAVGVEDQRVAGRAASSSLRSDLGVGQDAQQRAGRARPSRRAPSARSISGSGCPPAATQPVTRSPCSWQRDVEHRAEAVVAALAAASPR